MEIVFYFLNIKPILVSKQGFTLTLFGNDNIKENDSNLLKV